MTRRDIVTVAMAGDFESPALPSSAGPILSIRAARSPSC